MKINSDTTAPCEQNSVRRIKSTAARLIINRHQFGNEEASFGPVVAALRVDTRDNVTHKLVCVCGGDESVILVSAAEMLHLLLTKRAKI